MLVVLASQVVDVARADQAAAHFAGDPPGYYFIGGTSEGSPQWAGIAADLDQYAGQPLGFLNPALYSIGGSGHFRDIGRDIKVGNNGYNGVPGYAATPGWDLASGWGTPDLDKIMRRALELLDPTTDD